MNKYQMQKERVRKIAIEWQANFDKNSYSYSDLVKWQNYFSKAGKRYGLIKEFKENAII